MKKHREENMIILLAPIIFLFSALFHYVYDFTERNPLAALFFPVNESVWEHSKMLVIPTFAVWGGFYLIFKNSLSIDRDKWFSASLASSAAMLVIMPLVYYFYTQAFGISSVVLDILTCFIAVLSGQLVGLHFYKYWRGISIKYSLAAFALIILIFALATYYPPHIPLFLDSVKKTYGTNLPVNQIQPIGQICLV